MHEAMETQLLQSTAHYGSAVNQMPWAGKRISILGASIETLEGWNPRGYSVFYTSERGRTLGITAPEDTWWGMVIARFGGTLLVNNAWSGSRVTKLPNTEQVFPSACSPERTVGLHTMEAEPDVILIHMGANDFGYGVPIKKPLFQKGDPLAFFGKAYCQMLRQLRLNYPGAELWCINIGRTFMSSRPDFVFPERFAGVNCSEYNRVIEKMAHRFDCGLADVYHSGYYDTIDGTHPTRQGMTMLANLVCSEIAAGIIC